MQSSDIGHRFRIPDLTSLAGWRVSCWIVGHSLALLLAFACPCAAAPDSPAAADRRCGNHLLEAGEDCARCAADCAPAACTPGPSRTVTIALVPQPGFEQVGAVSVRLAYRTDRLTLPGKGAEPGVRARVTAQQPDARLFVNDLDHTLRLAVTHAEGLPAGPLAAVELAACVGAPAATAADVVCTVESCSSGGGRLDDCRCDVTVR